MCHRCAPQEIETPSIDNQQSAHRTQGSSGHLDATCVPFSEISDLAKLADRIVRFVDSGDGHSSVRMGERIRDAIHVQHVNGYHWRSRWWLRASTAWPCATAQLLSLALGDRRRADRHIGAAPDAALGVPHR